MSSYTLPSVDFVIKKYKSSFLVKWFLLNRLLNFWDSVYFKN